MKRLLFVAFLFTLAGCKPKVEEKPAEKYSLHGQVMRLEDQGHLVAIRHEEIKGWMGAMTMEFPVRESRDWSSLHEKDCIDAAVYVREKIEYWLAEVKHLPAEACSR